MVERDLTERQMKALNEGLTTPRLVLKHADQYTSGIPDVSVHWNGHSSWLENKLLEPSQTVHDELAVIQLETCIDLEQSCAGRCWVVCYVRGVPRRGAEPHTLIYRPTFLRRGRVPQPEETFLRLDQFNLRGSLWSKGVIRLSGHAHDSVVSLIWQTHS